jgi:hypothetical protein
MRRLVPLRLVSCFGAAVVYGRFGGIPHPWLQAVAVNICSLMVSGF